MSLHRFAGTVAFATFFTLSSSAFAADTDAAGSGAADRQVTFAKDVAPILRERCQECHH